MVSAFSVKNPSKSLFYRFQNTQVNAYCTLLGIIIWVTTHPACAAISGYHTPG